MMEPMRLTELVIDLCEWGEQLEDPDPNPKVAVYCDLDGMTIDFVIEGVSAAPDGTITIQCRRPP